MPRGGFGRGFGMRRVGVPIIAPMGMGSPLLNTLMVGGLGYMLGSNSSQQAAPQVQQQYPPYPLPGSPATPTSASLPTAFLSF